MAIHKTTDSYSTYDPYQDKFNVTTRSSLLVSNHSSVESSKDTLEISSEKLKEEALSKLGLKEKYLIPQNSFMKIGKYVFLAVAFPPYFALITIPKWILVEAIPMIMNWTQQFFVKGCEKAKGPCDFVIDKMKQVIHFMESAARSIIKPVANLLLEVKSQLSRFKAALFYNFRKISKPFGKGKKKIKNSLSLLKSSFKSINFLLKKVKFSLENTKEILKNAPEDIKKLLKIQFIQLTTKALDWSEKTTKFLESYTQKAENGANKVLDALENVGKKIKIFFLPVLAIYKRVILQPVYSFFELLQKFGKKFGDFLDHKNRQRSIFIAHIQKKIALFNSHLLIDRWLSHPIFAKLPDSLKNLLKAILNHSVFHRWLKIVVRGWSHFLTVPLKSINFLSCFFLDFFRKISDLFGKSVLVIQEQIKRFLVFCKYSAVPFLAHLIWKTSYSILLFFMIVAVLTVWLWRLLGETSNNWTTKMSRKIKNSN